MKIKTKVRGGSLQTVNPTLPGGGGTGGGTSDAKMKQATDLFDKGFNKEQITAIGQQLRNLLANRKKELIGGNRYLVKQFPNVVAPNAGVPVSYNQGPNTCTLTCHNAAHNSNTD